MKKSQDRSVFPQKEERIDPPKRGYGNRTFLLTLIGGLMVIALFVLKFWGYTIRKEFFLIAMFICGCSVVSGFMETVGKKK